MASEISSNLSVVAEARISPNVGSPARSSSSRPVSRPAPEGSPPPEMEVPRAAAQTSQEDSTLLASLLERAQNVALSNTTTLSFERDERDGKIYIHIKDKRTGEDLYRIPKKYLNDPEHESSLHRQLDLRV